MKESLSKCLQKLKIKVLEELLQKRINKFVGDFLKQISEKILDKPLKEYLKVNLIQYLKGLIRTTKKEIEKILDGSKNKKNTWDNWRTLSRIVRRFFQKCQVLDSAGITEIIFRINSEASQGKKN